MLGIAGSWGAGGTAGGRTASRTAELSEPWWGFDPHGERAKAAAFVRWEALKSPKTERGAQGGWLALPC